MADIKVKQAGSKENSYTEKKDWKEKRVKEEMASAHDVINLK